MVNTVMKRFIIVFLFGLVGYGCNLITNVIISNHLSLDVYGDFAVAWRALQLISLLMVFGSTVSANKYVQKYIKSGSSRPRKDFLIWNMTLVSQVFVTVTIIYFCFIGLAEIAHYHEAWDGEYHLAMYVVLFAPFWALALIFINYALVMGRSILASFLYSVGVYGAKLIVFGFGFFIFLPQNYLHLSYLMFAYVFLLFLIGSFSYGMLPDNDLGHLKYLFSRSLKKKESSAWFELSKQSEVMILCTEVTDVAGLFILEFLDSVEFDVGFFNVCFVCVKLILFSLDTLTRLYEMKVTTMSNLSQEESNQLQKTFYHLDGLRVAIVLVSMAIFYEFAPQILYCFNIDDTTNKIILPIMVFGLFFRNSCILRLNFLVANGQDHFCSYVQIIRAVIMIGLGSILCLHYGLYGVVLADLLSKVFAFVCLTLKCRKLTPMRFNFLM
ncbi:MAG: hypothetical protein CMF42_05710 [Legionellales bacterium]|nr:hypothetical protein [Legionellales bacterium]OUX66908.1 MAG: hypothetical protein CBD38_04055 [bacterium TMED178]